MHVPANERLFQAIDATWPPVRTEASGPFKLRVGAGGGSRVSAATLIGSSASAGDIKKAAAVMRGLGQTPLFMIRPQDTELDSALTQAGYRLRDPVVVFTCDIGDLARHAPRGLSFIPTEAPLNAQKTLWAQDGIGPPRLAVMSRAAGPATMFVSRHNERVSGAGFVACDDEIAMAHALIVDPDQRRSGVGASMTRGAAHWAERHGADVMAILTTRENTGAIALYTHLGMQITSSYHYRVAAEE